MMNEVEQIFADVIKEMGDDERVEAWSQLKKLHDVGQISDETFLKASQVLLGS